MERHEEDIHRRSEIFYGGQYFRQLKVSSGLRWVYRELSKMPSGLLSKVLKVAEIYQDHGQLQSDSYWCKALDRSGLDKETIVRVQELKEQVVLEDNRRISEKPQLGNPGA